MSTTLAFHIEPGGVTQYMDYPFTGMCNFNGQALGIKSDGLYKLDNGNTDGDDIIKAGFALPKNDFSIPKTKRVHALRFHGSFTKDIKATVVVDGNHIDEYIVNADATEDNVVRSLKLYCRRKRNKGSVFSFLFENLDGGYFCINNIFATLVLMQ